MCRSGIVAIVLGSLLAASCTAEDPFGSSSTTSAPARSAPTTQLQDGLQDGMAVPYHRILQEMLEEGSTNLPSSQIYEDAGTYTLEPCPRGMSWAMMTQSEGRGEMLSSGKPLSPRFFEMEIPVEAAAGVDTTVYSGLYDFRDSPLEGEASVAVTGYTVLFILCNIESGDLEITTRSAGQQGTPTITMSSIFPSLSGSLSYILESGEAVSSVDFSGTTPLTVNAPSQPSDSTTTLVLEVREPFLSLRIIEP